MAFKKQGQLWPWSRKLGLILLHCLNLINTTDPAFTSGHGLKFLLAVSIFIVFHYKNNFQSHLDTMYSTCCRSRCTGGLEVCDLLETLGFHFLPVPSHLHVLPVPHCHHPEGGFLIKFFKFFSLNSRKVYTASFFCTRLSGARIRYKNI